MRWFWRVASQPGRCAHDSRAKGDRCVRELNVCVCFPLCLCRNVNREWYFPLVVEVGFDGRILSQSLLPIRGLPSCAMLSCSRVYMSGWKGKCVCVCVRVCVCECVCPLFIAREQRGLRFCM